MAGFYDIDGNPMTIERWGELVGVERYGRVASTLVNNKRWWVSTVWLGLDHSLGNSQRPLIFETCVFDNHDLIEYDTVRDPIMRQSYVIRRYATSDSARRGHRQIVKKLREGVMPQDIE